MSSIKYNLDLNKIFDVIEKNINLNIDTMKNPPGGNFTIDANPFGRSKGPKTSNKSKEYDNPYSNNKNYYDPPTASDEYGYSSSEDNMLRPEEYYSDDNYSEMDSIRGGTGSIKEDAIGTNIKDGVNQGKPRGEMATVKPQSSRRFSKDVSRERLKEAVIWSEILGPPISKQRQNGTH